MTSVSPFLQKFWPELVKNNFTVCLPISSKQNKKTCTNDDDIVVDTTGIVFCVRRVWNETSKKKIGEGFSNISCTYLSMMAPPYISFCIAILQECTIALFTQMYSGVLPMKSAKFTSAPEDNDVLSAATYRKHIFTNRVFSLMLYETWNPLYITARFYRLKR